MTQETEHSTTQDSEISVSLIQPTAKDWDTISSSEEIKDPRERCYIIGDLAVLDPKRTICIPTQEDWGYFFQRTVSLNEANLGITVRNPLILQMAKVDRDKAIKALEPGELDSIWKPALQEVLTGKAQNGLYPGSLQEFLICVDPKGTQLAFEEQGETAWNAERKYLPWFRKESPADLFTLLAALSEIDKQQTLSLLEKSDLRLAYEGLTYYRQETERNPYRTRWLISHLAALKKLTPLFEELLQQKTS